MKRYLNILILFGLLAVVSGCAGKDVLPALQKGMGGLHGVVKDAGGQWAGREITLWAAPYYTEGSSGFYVLEPYIHPHVVVGSGGRFTLAQVLPGSYVLVAGPGPEEALRLVDDKGQTLIVTVEEGKWVEVSGQW
jgi:hypothetical protein